MPIYRAHRRFIGPNTHQPKLSNTVILSAAKDLSRWAARCFAEFTLSAANVLSMTGLSLTAAPWQDESWQDESVPSVVTPAAFSSCHPERSEGSGCFPRSFIALLPSFVTLSEAKGLSRWARAVPSKRGRRSLRFAQPRLIRGLVRYLLPSIYRP